MLRRKILQIIALAALSIAPFGMNSLSAIGSSNTTPSNVAPGQGWKNPNLNQPSNNNNVVDPSLRNNATDPAVKNNTVDPSLKNNNVDPYVSPNSRPNLNNAEIENNQIDKDANLSWWYGWRGGYRPYYYGYGYYRPYYYGYNSPYYYGWNGYYRGWW